jgi:hypothetical protein
MSRTFSKNSETLTQALQKLCFFNGTGGFDRLIYQFTYNDSQLCKDCRYRGACLQKQRKNAIINKKRS